MWLKLIRLLDSQMNFESKNADASKQMLLIKKFLVFKIFLDIDEYFYFTNLS